MKKPNRIIAFGAKPKSNVERIDRDKCAVMKVDVDSFIKKASKENLNDNSGPKPNHKRLKR